MKTEKNDTGLEMKYFVLNPTKNDAYGVASREAMIVYATTIQQLNPTLADDLLKWVKEIWTDVGDHRTL